MDKLEKVEKLRERANVSYEEARAALEENGWDLLDAMVALEKAGRTDSPKMESFSTSYDQQEEYIPVRQKVEQQQNDQPHLGRSIGEVMRNIIRICRENSFCIRRHSNLILHIPLLAAVIIIFFTWRVSVPVMLISLLFSFRYSLEGKDDLKEVNEFMDSAGRAAENLKEGFMNSHSSSTGESASENGAKRK